MSEPEWDGGPLDPSGGAGFDEGFTLRSTRGKGGEVVRVTIELLPGGDESRAEVIGQAAIINDCSGSAEIGNYDVLLLKSPRYAKTPGTWKKGRVERFPRLILGPYDLLFRALAACVLDRNRRGGF